ncbi:MAG TPA: tetratricopeptide repeat protein [Bacillota bacterium]|nr:tetratricopeptide repeat protein [Bacillota bacterium]
MMPTNHFRIQSIVSIEVRRILTLVMFLGLMGLILIQGPSQIVASSPSFQEPDLLFQQANEHYQQGRYDQALLIYQGLIEHGYQSGNLYYNLGNTYLKLGQKGEAVLYYEKARRLSPGDPALNTNLERALKGVKEGAPNRLQQIYRALIYVAPLNLLTVIASALLFLFVLFICLGMLLPGLKNKTTGKMKRGWLSLTVVTGVLLFCMFSVTALTYFDQSQKQAVIVKSGVNVYFEPQVSETISFKLDEGTRIYLLETKDSWIHVKRLDGKQGWIQAGGYEEL